MTVVELARLVADLRRAQWAYFKSRSSADLAASKAIERRVDRVVRECLAPPSLFDREPTEA